MENPNFVDPHADMNLATTGQTDAEQGASKLSEEEARKLVLESYEKAGVDLPVVSLETVLDRDIGEDDGRQSGAPRFRKFLNKASSAVANRLNRNDSLEMGPDDEVDQLGDDAISLPSVASYTANNINTDFEAPPPPPPAEPEEPAEIPQTPDRAANIPSTDAAPDAAAAVIPPTPESAKNDCYATFDYCCPKQPESSPAKYVVSNLQLPEGFEDEQQSVSAHDQPRDVPALMDTDVSMMDESSFKEAEGLTKGNGGFLGIFRGSRRFRFAVAICCLLHLVLVGLIIAFVMSADNESFGTSSSSASLSQGQPTSTPPAAGNADEFFTSKTLMPDPDVVEQIEEPLVNTTDVSSVSNVTSSTEANATVIEETDITTETDVTTESNATESCLDSLSANMNCVGEDTELYVSFESCTPQVGDWVAIYEASADPQNLLDAEVLGWLYTCGDRFCEEAVQAETLSFTRAKERAEEGTYRAHLLREGTEPFSAIASSPEFKIVTGANATC